MASTDTIQHVSDASFDEEVTDAEGLTLVDFWAEWCGPCKMIAPTLDELAEDFRGKIKICKVDVDANPRTAQRFAVRSIPSLLFFKNGQVVETVVGAVRKQRLAEVIEAHT